jgi:chromate transporter
MQAVFFGVGACVIGIIAVSAVKLTRKTVGADWLLCLVLAASAVCTVATETEYVALFLGAGFVVWLIRRPPSSGPGSIAGGSAMLPLAIGSVPPGGDAQSLWQIALFFTKAGAFVFGSGLAIVPFLYSGVVNEYRWLDEGQFLDAVAVAMITPGPVVITVGFIGYLVSGFTGACLASLATFLPCYLFTILPAPLFKKYGSRPGIALFVDGVTAAAIGAICGAVVVLARRTIFEDPTGGMPAKIVILSITVVALSLGRSVPEPLVVLAAALAGLMIYPWVAP